MRCFACDSELSDYEATLKSSCTGQYLDLCFTCIAIAEISAVPASKYIKSTLEEEENDIP